MLASPRRSTAQVKDEYLRSLAALGLRDEQADDVLGADAASRDAETVELWPEHLDSVSLFMALQTQWRVGPRGAFGLDYAVVPQVARAIGLRRRGWRQRHADLVILEDELLKALDEREAAEKARRS